MAYFNVYTQLVSNIHVLLTTFFSSNVTTWKISFLAPEGIYSLSFEYKFHDFSSAMAQIVIECNCLERHRDLTRFRMTEKSIGTWKDN